MKFTDLHLAPQLLEALDYMGFSEATPIQEKAIPLILQGKDLLACAQTGTGKTAAFLLPILNDLIGKEDTNIDTLILVPTRELAMQIEQQIQGLSYFISVGSKAIYGGGNGKDWSEEKTILKNGTDIIVATPGKLISHLNLGNIDFGHLKHFVLDEADRMLDMGFIDDINRIIKHLPEKRQTLMFSATMPPKISLLAKNNLNHPEEIALSISKPAAGVSQGVYLTFDEQKIAAVIHILKERTHYESILIFTSTKKKVNEIVRGLLKKGFEAQGISSDFEQEEREEVLRGFRSKRIRIVVATDVLSRGIDIKDINLVINYDVPHDAEDYVHRIGRTARANTKGESFTLVNPLEMRKFQRIEQLIEKQVEHFALPEKYGPTPEWKIERKSKSKPKSIHFDKKKIIVIKKSNQPNS
jgi:superfamily II DNA/RNA helicase